VCGAILILISTSFACAGFKAQWDYSGHCPGRHQESSSRKLCVAGECRGYRLLTVPFALVRVNDVREFSVAMVPDNFRRSDTVEVTADVFQAEDSPRWWSRT